MTQQTLYFAGRKTITDNSDWGDDISQHSLLTIYGVTRGKVAQITEDSNLWNEDDTSVLERFIAQNPGFRRRKEKILYLITDYQLLLKLLGSTGYSEVGDEDDRNTTSIDYDFDIIDNNEGEAIIYPDGFEGVTELCKKLGIKTIKNIPESILTRIKNLEPLYKRDPNFPDFSALLED